MEVQSSIEKRLEELSEKGDFLELTLRCFDKIWRKLFPASPLILQAFSSSLPISFKSSIILRALTLEEVLMSWALEEMQQVNLGDKRLETRTITLLDNLGSKPLETIPAACQGWAETKVAYRFFDNDKVTADKILLPHLQATLKRMQSYPVVLLIQDTTHLNYSTQFQKKDIGPLIHNNYRGVLLHPTIAVTPEGLCLGVIDDYHWHRRHLTGKTRHQKNVENLKTPIKDKESYRWIRGYQKANTLSLINSPCIKL
jgi:Transposase DNA-binding